MHTIIQNAQRATNQKNNFNTNNDHSRDEIKVKRFKVLL